MTDEYLEWLDAQLARCQKQVDSYTNNPGMGLIAATLISITHAELGAFTKCKERFVAAQKEIEQEQS